MVTNTSFPLRRAAGSFKFSFTKWLRGTKTVQLPVTFSMSFQIFTSICFTSLKNISPVRFAEVSESDVEKFIEREENEKS